MRYALVHPAGHFTGTTHPTGSTVELVEWREEVSLTTNLRGRLGDFRLPDGIIIAMTVAGASPDVVIVTADLEELIDLDVLVDRAHRAYDGSAASKAAIVDATFTHQHATTEKAFAELMAAV